MTNVLDEIRTGPRTTIRPGDLVRIRGEGSALFRVARIRTRPNGRPPYLDLWGPVNREGKPLPHAMQRSRNLDDVTSKARAS